MYSGSLLFGNEHFSVGSGSHLFLFPETGTEAAFIGKAGLIGYLAD